MKITETYKHRTKLLKLELLKTKIYKKDENFTYLSLKNLETRLKKALNIIYKFHIMNKGNNDCRFCYILACYLI